MARATTTAASCAKKERYDARAAAQVHLDLLLLTQPFGNARVYRCDNEETGVHYHISGRPAHVYAKKEGRARKEKERMRRDRHRRRRRQDEEPAEFFPARGLFVAEVEDFMVTTQSVESSFDEAITRQYRLLAHAVLDEEGATAMDEADEVIAGAEPAHLGETIVSPEQDDDKIGHAGMDFAWVPVNEIKADDKYQRLLSPSRVNEIAENLNPFAFGMVYLSQRGDGSLYALDGQHRVAAIETKYGPGATKQVPAMVLRSLSPQDEARFYYIMNRHRLQPTAHDAFKARLAFDDEAATNVKRALDDRGIVVSTGMTRSVLRFNEVQAIAEIENLYRTGYLHEVLDVIGEAWRGRDGAHRAVYLKGIRTFLETFWDEFYADTTPQRVRRNRRERLIDALAALGPAGLDDRAKFYADTISARAPIGMARGIHRRFNQGLRGVIRLPQWGEGDEIERGEE